MTGLNESTVRVHLFRAARKLRDLGEKVDLPTRLGMVMTWKLIGPRVIRSLNSSNRKFGPLSLVTSGSKCSTPASGTIRYRP